MISETRLARGYGSFWRSVAPTMELFVKRCNLDRYSRNFEPLISSVDPDRRAIVNQIAFEVFCIVTGRNISGQMIDKEASSKLNLTDAASKYDVDIKSLSATEINEISELAKRMWVHFAYPVRRDVRVKPFFHGCGIVTSCIGDVMVGQDTIVEMKDGDRPYRSYEFRQISIYCALNYFHTGIVPKRIELLNSRRGTVVEIEIEEFAREISGQSAIQYLYEIIKMTSDITISQ